MFLPMVCLPVVVFGNRDCVPYMVNNPSSAHYGEVMASRLFTPVSIGSMELTNRVTIAAMCQYSAVDGTMTDWHLQHLANLALSGASMMLIEATGMVPEGRITHWCTGLYSDANEASMKRVVDFVRTISPIRIGLQLNHAGR